MWPIILIFGIHKATVSIHVRANFGQNRPSGCWEKGIWNRKDRRTDSIESILFWSIILICRNHKGTDRTHLPARFGPNWPCDCWEIDVRIENRYTWTAIFLIWNPDRVSDHRDFQDSEGHCQYPPLCQLWSKSATLLLRKRHLKQKGRMHRQTHNHFL